MITSKLMGQYKKYGFVPATKNLIYHWLTRERRCSFGSLNSDKIFYVIRSIDSKSPFYIGPVHNLLANYFYVLSHIKYAQVKGWIPVVDQLHYPVYNSLKQPVHGTMNAWEYFWEQPSEYTLEEVYNSKNVILSKKNWFSEYDMGYDVSNYHNINLIKAYHQLSLCVPLKKFFIQHVEKEKNYLLKKNKRYLGVSFRFGGYSRKCFKPGAGHPIQPEINELLKIIKKYLQEEKFDYVFLTTDIVEVITVFKEFLGDKIIVFDRSRMSEYMTETDVTNWYKIKGIHKITTDYLIEMELLSQCTGIIGSITSGLRYAIVRNGGAYELCNVLDYGLFSG